MGRIHKLARAVSETLERRVLMCGDDDDGIVSYPTPPAVSVASVVEPAVGPTFPLSSVPQLSSRSSATKKLYLNFVGDTVANWGNNSATGQPYHPGTIPAYDSDGDPTTFSQTELNNIQLIWTTVADKYSPFNLDVTTIKPSNTAHGAMFQMDIGGTSTWYSATAGGVAIVGSFSNAAYPNLGFDFSNQPGTGSETDIDYLATDAAHESGHGFGLNHQGTVSNSVVTEYSNGNSTTAPIMGNAGNLPNVRGIWFNGTETGADSGGNPIVLAASQDDLSILSNTTNGFGYRPDDWTYTNYQTMQFNAGTLQSGYGGVIENTGDDDPFLFQATGISATFTVNETTAFGMLAPAAVIETPQQSVVATSVNSNTGCTITVTNLVPGNNYFLDVKSQGGYGDIGSYQIAGSINSFAYVSGPSLVVTGFGNSANNIFVGVGGGNYVLTDALNGGATTISFPTSGILAMNISLGSANDTVNFGDGSLAGFCPVTIDGGGGTNSLVLDDSSSPNVATYLLGSSGTVGGTAVIGSGNPIEFYPTIGSVSLQTSATSGDVVNVAATLIPTTIIGKYAETVNVGEGSTSLIRSSLSITNPPAFTQVVVDDSAETLAHPHIAIGTSSITGMSPGTISWATTDVSAFTLYGSSGGNNFFATGTTGNYLMTVYLGAGSDVFQSSPTGNGYFSIIGQAGTDSVGFYEPSGGGSVSQAYNFSSTGFTRSGLSVAVDSTVESLILGLGTGPSVVTINALPPVPVQINGYPNATDTYNVGTGSHTLPYDPYGLNISDPNGNGTLTLDDSADTGYTSFEVDSNGFYSTYGNIQYTVNHLIYDTASGAGTIRLQSAAPGTIYTFNGGNGNDTLYVGSGDLTNVQGTVAFNGGSGTNSLVVNDSSDPTGRTYNLSYGAMTIPGQLTVSYPVNVESVTLDGGTGNDTVNVGGSPAFCPISILPGGGINTVSVSPASNLSSILTVNGSGGSTSVAYYALSDGSFQLSAGAVSERSLTTDADIVAYSSVSSLTVNTNNGGSGYTFNVSNTAAGTPVTINNGSGTITMNVTQTSPTGPVTIFPTSGNDPINVDAPGLGTGPASVVYAQGQQTGLMNIGSAGLVTIAGTSKLILYSTGLAVTGNGTIDLTTNDFAVHNGTLSTITALARTGLNLSGGGKWNGPGLTSSAAAADTSHLTAVGVVQNNQSGTPLFSDSKTLDNTIPSPSDIIARYTWFGDANLDGKVDGADYSKIDAGYSSRGALTGWLNGDFNYDNVIDGSDYALIDNSFNNQRSAIPTDLVAKQAATIAAPAKPTGVTASKKALPARPVTTARMIPNPPFLDAGPGPFGSIPIVSPTVQSPEDALDRLYGSASVYRSE